MTKYGQSYR